MMVSPQESPLRVDSFDVAPWPSLQEFYAQKTVLLTGVTGFLGKIILERLLWEFPKVKELRIMIRGEDPTARLQKEVLSSALFNRLRQKHGEDGFSALVASKLRPVGGDVAQERMGLDDEAYALLAKDTDVILHCAALVAWGERLDRSMESNSVGCLRVLRLAQLAGARLVHVSTAFVHGQRRGSCAEELVQPAKASANARRGPPVANGSGESHIGSNTFMDLEIQACREFAESTEHKSNSEDMLKRFAREAQERGDQVSADQLRTRWVDQQVADWGLERAQLQGWWDNYTYSKALGEMLLNQERGNTPVAVVRPSGITSCMRDPEPGWIDAYLLVEPLIEGVGRGLITGFPGDPRCVIDTLPADLVTNVIIVAASRLPDPNSIHATTSPVPVYQCASGDTNPQTLGEIERTWLSYFAHQPMQNSSGRSVRGLKPIVYHENPADFVQELQRKYATPLGWAQWAVEMMPAWRQVGPLRNARGFLVRKKRGLEKTMKLAELYSAYTLNDWIFATSRTRDMMSALCVEDQERFPFTPQALDWERYWKDVHIPGMRKYVLKEAPTPTSKL